jgi:hypothetical protein
MMSMKHISWKGICKCEKERESHSASENGYSECVCLLIAANANVDIKKVNKIGKSEGLNVEVLDSEVVMRGEDSNEWERKRISIFMDE